MLVASEADVASVNQRTALLELASWEDAEPFRGLSAWTRGDLRLVSIPEHHLYRDGLDRDLAAHFGSAPELVVYLSMHRAESLTPSLTVHPVGNPSAAAFGGRPGALVPASPAWMTGALRGLREHAAGLSYAVTFEATHHGPYLETPTFYIEQGSTEREWSDADASRAIARTLLDLRPADGPVAVGLGGGHYVPRHSDVALERRVAFGHLLPTRVLESADPAILDAAVQRTPGARVAYVHRKSLGTEDLRRWEARLMALGLRIVRAADLEDGGAKTS